jgi:hypothetical protein
MTHTSPPRIAAGAIKYHDQHPAARPPHAPIRVTVAQIKAALPACHYGDAIARKIEGIRLTVAALDVIDGRRDAAGNLSVRDAEDYEIFGSRIMPALRQLRLYPASA